MWRVRRAGVLLPRFTPTGRSWDPLAARLGGRYPAQAPHLRGHGSASEARPVSVAECVGDVVGAAPKRFLLAGYSMGGRVALRLALEYPGRVEGLVLIGTTPGIADPVEREARSDEDSALASE